MAEADDPVALEGGCVCGAVRYRVTRPVLTAYICHCRRCQRRTGSAFSLAVVLPADGLHILQGDLRRTERALPGGGVNASWACPECFSRIHTRLEGRRTVNLRAGTLDDPTWIRPVAQIWTSSAQPWAVVREGLLTYEEQPSDFTPWLAAWREAGLRPPAAPG